MRRISSCALGAADFIARKIETEEPVLVFFDGASRDVMHRAGQAVGRTEIIEHIYAQDFDRDSNTVEVFVSQLRQKLGADFIETVRGQGYRVVRG